MSLKFGHALFLCAAATTGLTAADNDYSRKSLAGLAGVYVLVEELKPAVEQTGLTQSTIKNDAEMKLRVAGLQVFGDAASAIEAGFPTLYISTSVITASKPSAFNIRVALQQSVTLVRNPAIKVVNASTWSVETGITIGSANAASGARSAVNDGIDRFIKAYAAANPKS